MFVPLCPSPSLSPFCQEFASFFTMFLKETAAKASGSKLGGEAPKKKKRAFDSDQSKRLKAAFDLIDTDQSNSLDARELLVAVRDARTVKSLLAACPALEPLLEPHAWFKAFVSRPYLTRISRLTYTYCSFTPSLVAQLLLPLHSIQPYCLAMYPSFRCLVSTTRSIITLFSLTHKLSPLPLPLHLLLQRFDPYMFAFNHQMNIPTDLGGNVSFSGFCSFCEALETRKKKEAARVIALREERRGERS